MMWQSIVIYFGVTILLAFVDKLRRDTTMGKVANIDHRVSWILGAIGGIVTFLYTHKWHSDFGWDWIFFLECVAIRGLIYDSALNLFNRERWNYQSKTTSSKTDPKEYKLFKTFWKEKLAYLLLLTVLIITHLILRR